jgi:hypothetical protein
MDYSRKVERVGGSAGKSISSRNRREDRRRKGIFEEYALAGERSSGETPSREEPFEESSQEAPSPVISQEKMRHILGDLRSLGENPWALLDVHTPLSPPLKEEKPSGRWVDSRG